MIAVWTIALALATASPSCDTCHAVVAVLNDGAVDLAYPVVEDLAVQICAKRYPEEACATGAKDLISIFLNSLADKYLDPLYACSVLSLCDYPTYAKQNFTQWVQDLYASVPSGTGKGRERTGETMAVAQVTDPHVDFFYTPGTNTDCGETICCQERFGTGDAGFWGDYSCDLPEQTFISALQSLSQTPVDFIIYTGDSASHDIMNQTEALKLYSSERLSALFSQYFSVPVYPVLGNNDGAPSEEFDFAGSQWLLDPLSTYYTKWLTQEALESFRLTGAYSQLHLNTSLRIVAINTQACKNLNFYLITNVTDPGGQIEFLISQLQLAEANNERVFILGHIPPGSSDCLNDWALHYTAVVARYSSVIAAQFFGHTHSDQFTVSKDPTTGLPATVQWVAPSVTTLSNRNPSYRVYQVDSGSYDIIDFTQYRLDLKTANDNNVTVWSPAYSFAETYGVADLSLSSVVSLSENLSSNGPLAVTYLTNYNAGGPDSPSTCDSGCLFSLYCDLTSATSSDYQACTNTTVSAENKLITALQGPWTYVSNLPT